MSRRTPGQAATPGNAYAAFGRLLEGRKDILPVYSLTRLQIRDAAVFATSGKTDHPNVARTDRPEDRVGGYGVRDHLDELKRSDDYEVKD